VPVLAPISRAAARTESTDRSCIVEGGKIYISCCIGTVAEGGRQFSDDAIPWNNQAAGSTLHVWHMHIVYAVRFYGTEVDLQSVCIRKSSAITECFCSVYVCTDCHARQIRLGTNNLAKLSADKEQINRAVSASEKDQT